MRCGDDDFGSAVLEERVGGLHDRAAGVDHVVHHDADAVAHVADNLEDAHFVGGVGITALVNDGQRGTQDVGPLLGHAHATRIGGDDRDAVEVDACGDVVREEREREEVVDGAIEEALDLRGVEIDRDEAVGPGGLEQIGHEARGDGLAAAVLLVLPRVSVERRDHRDALG